MEEALRSRGDAELIAAVRELVDSQLQRSARGLAVYNAEVAHLSRPALASYNHLWVGGREARQALGEVEHQLRLLPEFVELNGDLVFNATPFSPMPDRILQPFGVPARYQPGGVHTGLDLRGDRVGGQQPPIYAVDDGTVVHVGALYCLQKGACRGPHAIVIHHGNNVYSVYSHNSEASVVEGDVVVAGQQIGRQGNEGYSRGPHLHLEVHVGAPFSGDWVTPW